MNTKPDPTSLRAARELAEEIHQGKWQHLTTSQAKPAFECDAIIAEFRSRCPGLKREEYESVLGIALSEYRPPSAIKVAGFWFVAFTFVWALLTIPLMKRFSGGRGFDPYLLLCCLAAAILLRKKRSSERVFFATLNVVSGVVWVIFVIWAVRAFAQNFWR